MIRYIALIMLFATSAVADPVLDEAEVNCLTKAIYYEARNEILEGQYSVAQVIENRVNHPKWPDTFCKVIAQGEEKRDKCQFSFMCDGKHERMGDPEAKLLAQTVAQQIMIAEDQYYVGNATHYFAEYITPPYWAKHFEPIAIIATHIFMEGW